MNLILLANGFPYGNWEPFLETEIKYYDGFDAVHICAMQLRREHMDAVRPLPSEKIHVCPVPFAPMAVYALGCFRALADRNFYRELGRLFSQRRFSLSRLAWLLFYLSRSHHEAGVIAKYLKQAGLAGTKERTVVYSYRFDYQPYVALLLQKYLPGSVVIARGHGYDLYEPVRPNGYISMRPLLLSSLRRVYPVSDAGRRYLAQAYPAYREKLTVSRLGTEDRGVCPAAMDGGPLHLVSCSTLTPVKRVELIVQALAHITDREIYWTHYGEGPLMEALRTQCEKLPENIHWVFRGHIDNPALMAEYAETPYHLFLNVSSSEGLPVSIMEAMSFSIPCIATDVGGTGEIVRTGENGTLLPADMTPEALAESIRSFAAMPDEAYQLYRNRARAFWQEHYSAEANYTAFAHELMALGEE